MPENKAEKYFDESYAVVLMFMPKKETPFTPGDALDFNGPLAAALAFITGAAAGIVGAAEAFILVPIMFVVLKILQSMLALLILGTSLKIWMEIFF